MPSRKRPTRTRPGMPVRASGLRVVRRVPTIQEQMQRLFRDADPHTKTIVRELARLGFRIMQDVPAAGGEATDSRIYLADVGRSRLLLVLALAADGDCVKVRSVTSGRETMPARQAAAWLRKRAAR